MPAPPLNALLLAGGRSRRMTRDKATLVYEGKTQLKRTTDLLRQFCPAIYLSLRKGQHAPDKKCDLPVIEDSFGEIGPLGGILSAFSTHPNEAWLVVACDLPLLSENVLRHLLRERDSSRIATAYRSSHDNLPEPLCTIYEPRAFIQMQRIYKQEKVRCPRKILLQTEPKLLHPIDPRALDNVNTPEEYEKVITNLVTEA
ncbi:MAG: NTP transferase domain-containing protein [Opitutales bacterium]